MSVAAIAAAGCGSSTPTSTTTALSESAYCQQLADGPFSVKAPTPFNAEAVATAFGNGLSQLNELAAPSNLQSLQTKLVAAYSKVVSDAKAGDVATVTQDLRTLGLLRAQATKACQ